MSARYNVAPSQIIPVIKGGMEFAELRWGLIPSWAKDPKIGYKMLNARAETLAEKPSFKKSFERRRCAIVADGFYEWRLENKKKMPYLFELKSEGPFAFAGIWDSWVSPEGEVIETCSIITTDPNAVTSQVHNRMPAVLLEERVEEWIESKSSLSDLRAKFLQPIDADLMKLRPVNPILNNAANDSPECILWPGENSK